MGGVKRTLRALSVYYLFLAVAVIPNNDVIPCRFPLENISSLYLAAAAFCLFLNYCYRVVPNRRMKRLMLTLALMEVLLALLRGIKYSVFGSVSALARFSWYLFYVPLFCIPLLLFYIALYVNASDERRIGRKWGWTAAVTAVLILAVLTNDLHGLVIVFRPGFENWDREYSHGFLFYVIAVWQAGLYTAALAVLTAKCRVSEERKHFWLILVHTAVSVVLILLKFTDTMPKINGVTVTQFPDTLCCMVGGVLECCMQLGLIPTNRDYRGLMKRTSVPVLITDFGGKTVYRSDAAAELNERQFRAPDKTRVAEHTILRRMEIPGGYGFWLNDVTELDRINGELEAAGDVLAEETDFIRLQNELRERQLKIDRRTAVYDAIADRTQAQSAAISRIAHRALGPEDSSGTDRCRKQIALLAAYIKRYANLLLMSSESGTVSAGELGLSVAEVLRYLNLYGIPGELVNMAEGTLRADGALAVFEAFEALLEGGLSCLAGVCVNLSGEDGGFVCRLTLENMQTGMPPGFGEKLAAAGVAASFESEDGVGFFRFALQGGGGAA